MRRNTHVHHCIRKEDNSSPSNLISIVTRIYRPLYIHTLFKLSQSGTSTEQLKKKDIFKVITTKQGLDHNSREIVTFVSVNGE